MPLIKRLLLLFILLVFLWAWIIKTVWSTHYVQEMVYNYKMQVNAENEMKNPACPFGTYLTKQFEEEANVTREMNWSSIDANEYLNCNRISACDKEAMREYLINGRITVNQEPELTMDCVSIKRRIDMYAHTQYVTDTPYAIAANVYKDYHIIEMVFGSTYSSRNSYCYALDIDSEWKFKEQVSEMAACFDNVQVLKEEYDFNSKGHFQDHAHYRCTQELLEDGNWSYILYLQNHDFIMRTNSEMSQIINFLNGSQLHGYTKPNGGRYIKNRDWTARGLRLFKNAIGRSNEQLDTPIEIIKSPNQVFLSREFVTALDSELNMEEILDAFNVRNYYGTDEMLFATLAMATHLGLPGQASKFCENNPVVLSYTSNSGYVQWSSRKRPCLTKHKRHTVCIVTIEYLPHFTEHPGIIVNKIQSHIDMGFLICAVQQLKERSKNVTILKSIERYEKYSQVRERKLRANGTFDANIFQCKE